jgi:zinc protease
MSPVVSAGLSPLRSTLENGMVVLARQTTATPAVTIHAMIHAGTVHDPVGMPGVAHFVAKVLDRGTESRAAEDIAAALDDRGVSLSIKAGRHTTGLSVDCLSEDVDVILELVADIIRHPSFGEDQIGLRRREIITRLKQDEDNPGARAVQAVFPLMYGAGHPYAWPGKGTPASVERIGRADLHAFHQARYAPGRISLAIVGDIEPERAVSAAMERFGDWRHSDEAEAAIPAPVIQANRQVAIVPMPGKAQADIAYGFVTITRTDPTYYAWWVMNTVLGQYGIGGRIGDDVRERQGLAYYAFSSLDPHEVPGPLIVRAGVDGSNVDRAIATIDAQILKIAADGPTEEEIADTKHYLIGSLPRTLETNAGIAFFLQAAEHFGLGLDYDLRLPALIDAVSRDAAHEAASHLDPTVAAIAIAGPYDGSALSAA